MIKMIPLDNRIVVKVETTEEKTEGGIYIPETAKDKPEKGTVLEVGPGKPYRDMPGRQEMTVKAGDKILFSKYGGIEIKNELESILIMHEDDVLMILKETKEQEPEIPR
jgi:chaperonin GroES